MATPEEMGHDHTGRTLNRPDSDEPWDDLAKVLEEVDDPRSPVNNHVFLVHRSDIRKDVLVPRFYRNHLIRPKTSNTFHVIQLGDLVDFGVIAVWDGHGSPRSQEKGRGSIPYIRVSDIVNWELYRNPTSSIPESEYLRIIGSNKQKPETGDIIFVRRGSYRIGTVAMASPRDSNVLLTRELLTFRIMDHRNDFGLTPFSLLATLSMKTVQDQIPNLVCVDTTLPNIGDRWRDIALSIHKDKSEIERVSQLVEQSVRAKWAAQSSIDNLREKLGEITT